LCGALKGTAIYSLRRSFVGRALIVIQVTLAVVLLFGASLFAHSLAKLKTVDLGYDIDRVMTVDITGRGQQRKAATGPTSPVFGEILASLLKLPGVDSAALANPGMLSGSSMTSDVTITDSSGAVHHLNDVHYIFTSPGYLSTMRIPLLRGRDFTPGDRAGSISVALVNQHLASELWPGEDPIGKHLNAWSADTPDLEIVGLVGNTKYADVTEETRSIVYQAFDQSRMGSAVLQVRCNGPFAAVEAGVRDVVKSSAPTYQVSDVATMEVLRNNAIAQDRLLGFLSSLFGALGTALALIGIYGLISYSVSRRTREVGVRMSIGAASVDVLWLFMREVAALVGAGVLLGLPLALGLATFLKAMLFEVSTSDPASVSGTVAVLALGGLLAAFIPARRAVRINPVQALRYE
jgi:predicted permease